ncbi:MAG: hypothetical protein G01um101448_1179 [Parcubacteria group bacterium Gr01-1014_48]|nr:MAG: hypothetical protein G01um101448_1179 [Parcubacteria group bacterium Gr01-1014_48]
MFKQFSTSDLALLFLGFALVLFFSSYKLFASPETWLDEGLIIQSAQGLLETGKASLPVAPGVYEPAWYITTGFPLTLPLAGAFAVFGVSLEAARLVMLLFLLCLYLMFFVYARKAIGGTAAWLGFFLLIFFAPIYGNGRNALGEIPGLLMILVALWPLLLGGVLSRGRALWAGVGAGLAVAAKPIFLLFLPALLLALLLRSRELELKKVFLFGATGVLIPLALWSFFQFDHISFARLLAVYANPHDLDIGSAILTNIKRFGTEIQPLYFFAALLVWVASYGVRRFRRETVSLAEETLLLFSVLVFLAYIRTAGYYRYFFPAQVFALLYLPQSLWYLAGRHSRLFSRAIIACLCGVILFQAYETTFRSWTAVHYDSTRTEELHQYFATLPITEELFVYQAPEVVPFAGKRPLYQYVEIIPSVSAGKEYQHLVLSGQAPLILTPVSLFDLYAQTVFKEYISLTRVAEYVVLTPRNH